jgi:hypothetical protein
MFTNLCDSFLKQINYWVSNNPSLIQFLSELHLYQIHHALVYNTDLDRLNPNNIEYILVADNPGQAEQAVQRYLIGTAGKMARNVLAPLIEDFSKNVLVLNKTPIHTKSTKDIARLRAPYGTLLEDTQKYMAQLVFDFHKLLKCPVYIVGFSGCRSSKGDWLHQKRNGSYPVSHTLPYFFEELRKVYSGSDLLENLFLFKHFSYGNFTKDINALKLNLPLGDQLTIIGSHYRSELFKGEG